jgi:hypothetical protein
MWHLVGKIQLVSEEVGKWPPQRNPHEVAAGLAPRGGGGPRKRKEDFPQTHWHAEPIASSNGSDRMADDDGVQPKD